MKRLLDWKGYRDKFIDILKQNNINAIYHLTKLSNLNSIFDKACLFSKKELEFRSVDIDYCTNDLSKDLDNKKYLDDYIHFSFNLYQYNPNLCAFIKREPNTNFCILRLDIDSLAKIDGVKFSNINATTSDAIIFDDLDNFSKLDFDTLASKSIPYNAPNFILESFKNNKQLKYDFTYKTAQAEILIPTSLDIANLCIDDVIIQQRIADGK